MMTTHRHQYGIVRRDFLQVGVSGFLGLGLPGLLAGRVEGKAIRKAQGGGVPTPGRAKSIILVFLTGGPSHLDTFDMKPDAPDKIRGEFVPIKTNVPGISYCEYLPGLAAHADKLAVVRTMSHPHRNHLNGTHQILTGNPQPNAVDDKIASRDDYPCYASGLAYARPRTDGLPSGVMLPTYLIEGPLRWPGQHAGLLGAKYDPWQIQQDPNKTDFRVESLRLPDGFTAERLLQRRDLLRAFDARRASLEAQSSTTAGGAFAEQRELAYSLLLSNKVARAFDLNGEDPRVRDRYGRTMFGQSLLLARRLVEAGVPVIQANMGIVQNWDSHDEIFKRLKTRLLPWLDKGASALLEDLAQTGLLDETLVIITGEFGRTPKVVKTGRDHWSAVFSTAFAGAGVRGGQLIGASDKTGAYALTPTYSPGDLAATIYRALGVDPATELRDRLARPIRLCNGEVIGPLYAG
jgi:hypothetical protein